MDNQLKDFFSKDFGLPIELQKVIGLELINLKPWEILNDERIVFKNNGIKERYGYKDFIAFAIRLDNDDVACWDVNNKKVTIIHDYASPGWERRKTFKTFWDWFRQAVEDMIEFAREDIEYEQKNSK